MPHPSRLRRLVLLVAAAVVAAAAAAAADTACHYCGMTSAFAARSWMEFHYSGREPVGVCSLHCGAVHMALHPDEVPVAMRVADFAGGGMIDADGAHWVLGGDLPGVMTRRAKWAFRDPAAARRFAVEHGGTPATFDDALRAALEDLRTDTLMIQQRRRSGGDGTR